ncbi:MAG: tetratricopeptide repeat protein [Brumimicrobium sp.]
MYRSLRFFMICFVSLSSFSQEKPESFETLADKIRESTYHDSNSVFSDGAKAIKLARKKNDLSKEGLIYQYYGDFYFYSGRSDIALKYYDTTLIFAVKSNDSTLQNSTLIRQNFIGYSDDPIVAEKEFKRLLKISERRGDHRNSLKCLNGLGIIYEEKHDQGKALDYYLQAYTYAERIKDPYLEGMLLNNVGLIKYRNEQYDNALSDFKKGIILADSIENTRLAFNLQNNMGLLHEKTENYKESITHFQNSLINAKRIGFPFNIAITHLNLSNSYNLNDEYNRAIQHADSTILIFEQVKDFRHIAKPHMVKAEAYMGLGQLNKATETVKNALGLAKEQNAIEDLVDGHNLEAEILKSSGDFEGALEAYEEYYHLKDSIAEISNKKQFAELQVVYETERKEAELKEARAKSAMLETDNRLKESRMIIIIVVSVFIIITTIVIFYLRHLRTTQVQQRNFSRELIENLDEERLRISRDLHDDIGQSLSVAKSKINLFQKGQIDELDGLEDNLGDLIQQTRMLSHRLHPSYLEKIGLKRSIVSLLDRIEKNTGIITSHDIHSGIDDYSLMKQTQIYRILQECLNNTIKHADAKSIKVSITKVDDEFHFVYRDNGKGVDLFTSNKNNGLGMMTIKERTSKLGGKLQFLSQPKKGFYLIIRFQ